MNKKIVSILGAALLLAACQQTSTPQVAPQAARSLSIAALPPGEVYTVADLDEAPKVGDRRGMPKYPVELRRDGISGKVLVAFVVGADGRVYGASAIDSSHPGFVAPALEAASRWVYTPGKKAGTPVNCRMETPVNFNLMER